MPAVQTFSGSTPSSRPGPRPVSGTREDDEPLAPAQRVEYRCPQGHLTSLRMHPKAEPPTGWDCTTCGSAAVLVDGRPAVTNSGVGPGGENPHAPARPGGWYTHHHRAQVFARRSADELEALLAERLRLRRRAG